MTHCHAYFILLFLLAGKGTDFFVPFAFVSAWSDALCQRLAVLFSRIVMHLNRSNTFSLLLISQLVSLMSLILWGALFSFVMNNGSVLQDSGSLFMYYPTIPIAFSVFSWFAYRLRRWKIAVLSSMTPAVVAFALMLYFYIIGLQLHSSTLP